MLELIQVSTSMASPYKSVKVWVKHFFWYLVYKIFLWSESWRGSLYMYLLSFSRFWTLSIEPFWFLFWSILNSVTLKTSNYMPLGLPSNTTTRNGKMPHELLRPRFETKVGNFIYRRNKRTKKRQEITLQQLYSGYVKFSWGIYRKGPWKRKSRKCVFKRTGSRKDTRENLRKMMNLLQSKDS